MSNANRISFDPNNPETWFWFMDESIKRDNAANPQKPHGWHWFWGLYYLQKHFPQDIPPFDFIQIIKTFPNEHWLKIEENKYYYETMDGPSNYKVPETREKDHKLVKAWVESFSIFWKITEINFSDKRFDNFIDFSNFIFPVDVKFNHTIFSQQVIFTNAVFFNEAHFYDTTFSKEAGFENALFFKQVDFHMAVFYDNVEFSGVKFSQIAGFRGTKFNRLADFSNSKIEGHITFADAKFTKFTPQFYNATISPDIILETDINFWPQLNIYADNISQEELNEILRVNKNAYENLAYHMKKPARYHDEHFFFRQEMRCRRGLEKNILICLAFGLYEWFADYGYGIGQVFTAWFVHIILGAIAIFIIASGTGLGFEPAFFCSISTSFANANPFVFIGFKEGGLTDCYKVLHYLLPIEFGTIRGVQTFFGIPLLFMLLATLRIRFRLK